MKMYLNLTISCHETNARAELERPSNRSMFNDREGWAFRAYGAEIEGAFWHLQRVMFQTSLKVLRSRNSTALLSVVTTWRRLFECFALSLREWSDLVPSSSPFVLCMQHFCHPISHPTPTRQRERLGGLPNMTSTRFWDSMNPTPSVCLQMKCGVLFSSLPLPFCLNVMYMQAPLLIVHGATASLRRPELGFANILFLCRTDMLCRQDVDEEGPSGSGLERCKLMNCRLSCRKDP